MTPAAMLATAAAVVVLPFALAVAFHRRERADSRGRRTSTAWYVRRTR